MFCSKCGNQVSDTLKYCNVCGAKLVKNKEEENQSPLGVLIASLPFIVLGGLGILVGLLAMLLSKGVNYETVGIIAVFYLAALTAICFNLFRVMSRLIDVKTKAESSNEVYQPVQLPAVNTAQLEESKQQPFSVTDNTTRTFDKAYVKRN